MDTPTKDTEIAAGEFEAISVSNGNTHWTDTALCEWLGYAEHSKSFDDAVNRAIAVCTKLKISVWENFRQSPDAGARWHLTRFACYLIAMNGDIKKPQVARAQVYFAQMAEMLSRMASDAEEVERVHIRGEVADRNKSLSGVINRRGIDSFAMFHNAGYMGMYNMGVSQLRQIKGIGEGKQPLDFMGKRELAANLFRLTETEGRIKDNPNIRGQQKLEQTAFDVGRQVRSVMKVAPERLAAERVPEIREVEKGLKKTQRGLDRIDKKP